MFQYWIYIIFTHTLMIQIHFVVYSVTWNLKVSQHDPLCHEITIYKKNKTKDKNITFYMRFFIHALFTIVSASCFGQWMLHSIFCSEIKLVLFFFFFPFDAKWACCVKIRRLMLLFQFFPWTHVCLTANGLICPSLYISVFETSCFDFMKCACCLFLARIDILFQYSICP